MRHRHRRALPAAALAVAVLAGGAPSEAWARWESARDNKPMVELQGMTNEQLFNEAFDVCVRRALLERSLSESGEPLQAAIAEASSYLDVIYPYARERNGGTAPVWMNQLFTAHTTRECQEAFHTFVSGVMKAAKAEAAEIKPAADESKPQPKPVVRRRAKALAHKPAPAASRWSEQLPPWLAPRD